MQNYGGRRKLRATKYLIRPHEVFCWEGSVNLHEIAYAYHGSYVGFNVSWIGIIRPFWLFPK
jgi:hypothetical protein